jgi:NAD(P)-dependent dehydrogenase (short-subunit alcohol dehydrogenase family)
MKPRERTADVRPDADDVHAFGYEDAALLAAPPSLRLDGRVAWVTGASRGLGRALAFAFAGAGAELLLTARSEGPLCEIVRAIRDTGGRAHALVGSVTDEEHIAEAVALAERRWGRLDILINNAGISSDLTRAEHVDHADWQRVLDVNLSAPFRCSCAALNLLEAGGAGSIVNVSSVHGHVGQERLVAYSASKGGLEMMTRSLALEWAARGVRVNTVAPGYLLTDMTVDLRTHERWREELTSRIPMGRFGAPSEVVGSVLFLAGPSSSYVTGSTLFVDGGWTAR